MDITIGFRATEPGDYEGNVVVVTSAGEFPVHCRVLVEPSPDYSSIVTKGEFIFVPDNSYPFVVEDGKAWSHILDLKILVSLIHKDRTLFGVLYRTRHKEEAVKFHLGIF